ncbi:MAG: ribonuclease J [Bacillaceae bacterium]|nr:ribonuclease J [Bacillaceae bacterium]
MYGIEYKNEIVVVDSGLKFPEDHLPGVDLVIPDITYLLQNKKKVRGIFLTHGHEDHIGGLPYVLRELQVPVYGAPLTIALVKSKLQEHGLQNVVKLNEVNEHSRIRMKNLTVSFFRTNHSIPDSLGIAIDTPEGTIVHTGDFKFDLTPAGKPSDLTRMAQLGEKGVLALLSDSTNSEKEGMTLSEKAVGDTIDELFYRCKGRILFATFASNVYRLQQVVEASKKYNRKVAVIGRSMEKVFQIGQDLGYIQMPEGMMIELDKIDQYPPNKVTIVCTGSQGEPLAALTRIANGSHRQVQIIPGDTVIFSSSPIPGNTQNVYKTIDQLFRSGAEVIYGSLLDIHTSGHGSQEDLKLMLNLIRPKYFIPIHGEYRMLVRHSRLAEEIGVDRKNIFILDNGDSVYVSRKQAKRGEKIPSGSILVDGSGIGDVGNIVLRDRTLLSESGLIVVVVTVDMNNFQLLSGPDIISRGFVYVRESEALLREAEQITRKVTLQLLKKKEKKWADWKNQILDALTPFFYERTERSPMILPIIMEVNRERQAQKE